MGQPTARRPGFSRKAQYSIFFTYMLAVAGIGAGALLLLLSVIDPKGANALRQTAGEITAPISSGLNEIKRGILGTGDSIGAYLRAGSQNAALKKKVKRDAAKLIEAQSIQEENTRLKKLLGLIENNGESIAIGRLVSSTSSSTRRLATLSVGSQKGLKTGMPVRAPEGLVGRVLETGPFTARVLLITDTESVVPVKRVSDGLPAIATGLSNGLVEIRPLNVGINPFKKGDVLVTSGSGGLFPPNMPVARVSKKHDDGAYARPLADPASAAFVMVLPVFEQTIVEEEARQAREPTDIRDLREAAKAGE